ncbi:TPA: hypothetical protein HA219_01795 [Candidatus Woesearchaeota archaeon]|nr:hypothetical protein [Candidatus Woesearchaeota archaeon]HIH39433.1 hypothetical protein [Candidatus Woesearchaeota archaeon]
MKKIQEGKAVIEVDENPKVSKKLQVFYNPVMKLNRDMTVLLLNSAENKQMQIADIMAGTGVRSIRLINELKKNKIKKICTNDINSIKKIKRNFKLSNLKLNKSKVEFHSEDANLFLLKSNGFDYIDIDPFGTPNDFLDSSVKRLSRNGILGVTATDTSVLAGTYPKTCRRIYWSSSFRNGFMHESSLRILIRKVQLIGAQFEKALIPVFSYAKEHYARVFFRCIKNRTLCEELIKQHKYVLFNPKTLAYEVSNHNFRDNWIAIGPLFVGSLSNNALIKKMINLTNDKEAKKLLTLIHNELDIVGSYDLHMLSKKLKVPVPNFESIIRKAKATRVHYNPNAIKTKLGIEELKKLI